MRDPNAGKYKKIFKEEFAIAKLVLAKYEGELTWSQNDYEAFRFASPTVTLIFYPHKTTRTGNVSCRVRDQHSKDKDLAAELMIRLRIGSGFCNTFHEKSNYTIMKEHDLCKREGIEMGWAREEARNAQKA